MAQINELEELIRAVDRLTKSEKELAKVSGQISQLNDEIAVSEEEARKALIKKQDKLSDEQVLLNKKIKLQRQVVEEEKAAARAAGVSEKAIDRATSSTRKLNDESSLAARTLRQFGPVGRALATALELSRKSAGGLAGALKGVKTALIGSGIGLAIVAISKAVEILAGKITTWWKENYSLEASQEKLKSSTDDLKESVDFLTDAYDRLQKAKEKYAKTTFEGASDEEKLDIINKEIQDTEVNLAGAEKQVEAYNKQVSKTNRILQEAKTRYQQLKDAGKGEKTLTDAQTAINKAEEAYNKAAANLAGSQAQVLEFKNTLTELYKQQDELTKTTQKNTPVVTVNTTAIEQQTKEIRRQKDAIEELIKAQRGEFTSPGQSIAPVDSKTLQSIAKSNANTVKSTQGMIDEIIAQMNFAKVNQFESVEEYNNFMTQKAEELTAAYKQQNQERIDNEERTQQERIAIAQYGFDALNSVLDLAYADDEDKSRKAFERNKKLQYAQTLVNGASGSVAIWTDAQSGIKAKVAAQVALALSTAVALQQIARTRYDSGGTPDTGQTVGKSATELLSQSQTITSLQTQTQAAASQTVLVVSDVDYQQNFANSTRAKAVIS